MPVVSMIARDPGCGIAVVLGEVQKDYSPTRNLEVNGESFSLESVLPVDS